jgi:hypothetical protein
VKVRIKNTPDQREVDGIKLDRFEPGAAYEVSSSIGSWLVAEGYALPEMRRDPLTPDTRVRAFEGQERRHPGATDRASSAGQRNSSFIRS